MLHIAASNMLEIVPCLVTCQGCIESPFGAEQRLLLTVKKEVKD